MGVHSMQQENDRLTGRGLLGRGAMTGLAALALVGGGAGVALADEAPADAGQDVAQSAQTHDSKSSDEGKSADKATDKATDKASDEGKSSDKGSDEGKGSDQKGSDQKGSDEGTSPLSSLPGADALSSLPDLAPDVAAGLGGLAPEPVEPERRPDVRRHAAGCAGRRRSSEPPDRLEHPGLIDSTVMAGGASTAPPADVCPGYFLTLRALFPEIVVI